METEDFDLQKTLECGQFFRYERHGQWYFISHGDNLFKVRQEGNRLYYAHASRQFICSFFRLDDPYEQILSNLNKDSFMSKAIDYGHGLRIIRQDPWECLVSYICSSNSNIPKIRHNLVQLAACFGEPLSKEGYASHSFPRPGALNDEKKIAGCAVGYRAAYIAAANAQVTEEELHALKRAEYTRARKRLQQIHGVGPKVADCVCLFSLDKLEAFPVDVWIRRVMEEQYPDNCTFAEAHEFARQYFGRYAGYANQFMFYFRRNHEAR